MKRQDKVCKPMRDNNLWKKGKQIGITVKPLTEDSYAVYYPGLPEPIIMKGDSNGG